MAGQDILLGIGLGFATGYFVFTSTGRRMVGAGAGLAGAGAERGQCRGRRTNYCESL